MLNCWLHKMSFTVLSYNIQRGGEQRLSAIAQVIRSQNPDAVALVEANSPHHIAWLSRSPLTQVKNHRLSVLSRTLLEVEVRWEDHPLHLFATHLAPIWEGTGTLHIDEAEAVCGVPASHVDHPALLVGDFNALHPEDTVGTPPVREAAELQRAHSAPQQVIQLFLDFGLVDCYRAAHLERPGYTYSTDQTSSELPARGCAVAAAERPISVPLVAKLFKRFIWARRALRSDRASVHAPPSNVVDVIESWVLKDDFEVSCLRRHSVSTH